MRRNATSFRWRIASLVLGCGCVVAPQNAAAQEQGWLQWEAPEGCPSAEEVEARLEAWLGSPLVFEHDLLVKASVESKNDGYHVMLDLTYGGEAGGREVALDSCAEAADFVALTVALAVEPQLQTAEAPPLPPGVAKSGVAAGAAPASDPASNPGPQEEDSGDQTEAAFPLIASDQSPADEFEFSVSEEGIAPADTEAREDIEAPEADTVPAAAPTPTPVSSTPRWFIAPALAVIWGPLPAFSLGPTLRGGFQQGAWQASASAFYFPGGSYEFSEADNDVSMSFIGGAAQLCYLMSFSSLQAGPCASLQAGAVSAEEELISEDRSPHSGAALWLATLIGGEASLEIVDGAELYIGADLLLPLIRPEFVLESETSALFQSSLGFQAQLGLKFFF